MHQCQASRTTAASPAQATSQTVQILEADSVKISISEIQQVQTQNQEKQQKNHPFPIQFQEQFRNQSRNETGKNNKKAEIGQFFQG